MTKQVKEIVVYYSAIPPDWDENVGNGVSLATITKYIQFIINQHVSLPYQDSVKISFYDEADDYSLRLRIAYWREETDEEYKERIAIEKQYKESEKARLKRLLKELEEE